MAGPAVMSPVPLPTRQERMPSTGEKSRMPMSTGTTSQRAVRAIRQTGLCPAASPRATAAVASGPVWVTPWATTPLSAQRTSTARRSKSSSALPVRAAASSSMVSSKPRLPSGWASEAQRRWASRRAASSAGAEAALQRAAMVSNCCMMVFLSVCRGGVRKAGGQLGPARPIEVRERRVQPGRHKAAPPGPAVRLLGRQGRAGAGAVPVVELVGRDGLPLAEQEAVLRRRQAGIAEADQPPGGKALPRQDARHRPALSFPVGQGLPQIEEAPALGHRGHPALHRRRNGAAHGSVLAQSAGVKLRVAPRQIEPAGCGQGGVFQRAEKDALDRKSTRLNSSHVSISYAVFCLKKKKTKVHMPK